MAASLARDGDLEFSAADRDWATNGSRPELALILERTGRGVFYSKPVLYPLLAAPFAWVSVAWGPALLNLIVVLIALWIAWRSRLGWKTVASGATGEEGDSERRASRDLLLTFCATGLVLVYIPWRMTESLQLALALAGLSLCFAALRGNAAGGRREILGAILLGLLVSLREPNALVALAPVVAALAVRPRQPRRAFRMLAATLAAYAAVALLTWGLTGAINPYKAARSTFSAESGFPGSTSGIAPARRFDDTAELATSTLGLRPDFDLRKSAYAALYFFVGRHTGLLWYLPAALALFLAAFRSADRAGWAALASFVALAAFYLVWMPANYFGGETFVGNRYILAALPLLLVAPARRPGRWALAVTWLLAAVVAGSALLSVVRVRDRDATSQSHAHAGLFRLLPYESTASQIDGRRDRYWAQDFVRFTDPFARAEAWSFEIAAGDPAAELEIASRWDGVMNFLAHGSAPGLTLELSDTLRTERFELTTHADGGSGGPVEFTPSITWRRHSFWWNREANYGVRMLRFRALGPAALTNPPAVIRVRYLGRNPPPASGFARDVVNVELAGEAVAAAEGRLTVVIRNTGAFVWQRAAVSTTQLGLRFVPLENPAASLPVEERVALPADVRPGELLEMIVAFRWPERPGRYRATLDLVLEDVSWFEEKIGSPVARAEIEVRAKESSPAAGEPSR